MACGLIYGFHALGSRYWGLEFSRTRVALYCVTIFVIWTMGDVGLLRPRWMEQVLTTVVVGAYIFTGGSGGGGGPRRRKGSTWKRAKEWLARGIPAARPTLERS